MMTKLDVASKPNGFFMLIVGKPGSGKTTLIKEMLINELSGKFHYILVFSPSSREYYDIISSEQTFTEFNEEVIRKAINMMYLAPIKEHKKILFIVDDAIADIKSNEKNQQIISLFFNRRHLVDNGTISLLITTQKYTMVPARFRSCITDIRFFGISPFDVEKIYEESVIKYTKKEWKELICVIYENKFVNIHFDLDSQLFF